MAPALNRIFVSCLPKDQIERICREAHPELWHIHHRYDGGFQAYWRYRGYSMDCGLAGDLELSPRRPARTLLLVLDSALTPHRREINARLGRPKRPPEWLNQIFANIRDDLYVCWACEKAHTRDSKRWSDGKCMICQGELDHIVCRI